MRIVLAAGALALALALALGVAACDGGEPMSPAAYHNAFVEKLKGEVGAGNVSIEEDAIIVRLDEGEQRIFLDQSYRRYQAGETFDAEFARMMLAMTQVEIPFDAERTFILIRPAEMFQGLPETEPGNAPLQRPLVGDLIAVYAQDNTDSFAYPGQGEVAEKTGDADDAWDRSRTRTVAALGRVELGQIQPGLYSAVPVRDDLGGSLLFSDDFWARPDLRNIGGELAVGVFRDGLILADASNAGAVATARAFLAESRESPNFVSEALLVRREGQWVVLR